MAPRAKEVIQKEQPVSVEFRRHMALYAKGHYAKGLDIVEDVLIIAENTGFSERTPDGFHKAFREMIDMAFYAFVKLGKERFTVTTVIDLDTDHRREFLRMWEFAFTNRTNTVEALGLDFLSLREGKLDSSEVEFIENRLIVANILETLMLLIAKYKPDGGAKSLGEPDSSVLPIYKGAYQ